MQIAFYGTARNVGTSANMAAVQAFLANDCPYVETMRQPEKSAAAKDFIFTDCSQIPEAEAVMETCDLLVLNLSISGRGLETVYTAYSIVRKNVVFLIGKYIQNQSEEVMRIAREYRMEQSRICMIPYHPGFARAYEHEKVPRFLKGQKQSANSCADRYFNQQVERASKAVLIYANRKGDLFYG